MIARARHDILVGLRRWARCTGGGMQPKPTGPMPRIWRSVRSRMQPIGRVEFGRCLNHQLRLADAPYRRINDPVLVGSCYVAAFESRLKKSSPKPGNEDAIGQRYVPCQLPTQSSPCGFVLRTRKVGSASRFKSASHVPDNSGLAWSSRASLLTLAWTDAPLVRCHSDGN